MVSVHLDQLIRWYVCIGTLFLYYGYQLCCSVFAFGLKTASNRVTRPLSRPTMLTVDLLECDIAALCGVLRDKYPRFFRKLGIGDGFDFSSGVTVWHNESGGFDVQISNSAPLMCSKRFRIRIINRGGRSHLYVRRLIPLVWGLPMLVSTGTGFLISQPMLSVLFILASVLYWCCDMRGLTYALAHGLSSAVLISQVSRNVMWWRGLGRVFPCTTLKSLRLC